MNNLLRKVTIISVVALMCLTLAGCGKKDKDNSLNKQDTGSVESIKYDKLSEAISSKNDAFVYYIYSDNFVAKEINKSIQSYLKDNQFTIYKFDIDEYLSDYSKENKEELQDEYDAYVAKCGEQENVTGLETEENNSSYKEVLDPETGEIKHVYDYDTSQDQTIKGNTCKDNYISTILNEEKNKILQGLNAEVGDIVLIEGGYSISKLSGFLPSEYPFYDKEVQSNFLVDANKDLVLWLNDAFKIKK